MPPGDSGLPLFGHLLYMLIEGPQAFKLKRFQKYGPVFTQNLLMSPSIVVTREEDARFWLTQERKGNLTPQLLPHFKNLLGEETIIMQASKNHRRLRRIFEPSFSPSAVQGYAETVDATTKSELKKWDARGDFCSSRDWAKLAMRLFFVCAFGEVNEDLLVTLDKQFSIWLEGFGAFIPFALPGTRLYSAHVAKKELMKILLRMINDFKAKNPAGSHGAENNMMGRLCYGVDDEGKTLNDNQLVTNIQFVLFAGHDTTKGSFCAFAYFLTEHPKIRNMLIDEVKTFSEPLDVDQLKAAPVLNAFMAETWRIVAPLDSHNLSAAKDFEFKGYKIKQGTGVSIDIQAYNVQDGGTYKDPMEFRIERWLPQDHPLHNPKYFQEGVDYNIMSTKYRAFNMGSHTCLGAHFAKLEARIVLTRLLQNYDMEIRNNEMTYIPMMQYSNDFKLTKR
jgi:cytochrome P450